MPHDFFNSFVCNIEKVIVWCTSAMKKTAVNFRQKSLKDVLFLISVLQCFWKIFWKYLWKSCFLKKLYCTWTSSQVIFMVFSRSFFTYLPTYLCTETCLSYRAYILYICVHICKRLLLLIFIIPEMKNKRKTSLSFWITFATWFDHLFNIYIVLSFNKSFQLLLIHLPPLSIVH